jgi:hypothetical protein
MSSSKRLSDLEYDKLANEFAENPPALSGNPGHITLMRQKRLVEQLVSANFARIINLQAEQKSVSPSEIIEKAIEFQIINQA